MATIPTELEEFVQSEVERGSFTSREEVIATALTEMRDRRLALNQRLEELLAEEAATPGEDIVLHGEAELKAYFESVKSRGRERLAQKRATS